MAQAELYTLPQRPLTDEQQVRLYLAVMATPPLASLLRAEKGNQEFEAWVESMQEKSRILGLADVNLSPELKPSDKDELTVSNTGSTAVS